MNPTNNKNPGCSPVSSNCVIWQGPDLECIGLCKGATISDVAAAMAKELCQILDYLKISNYDLSCLALPQCPPKDFQALIQLIIDKVCALEENGGSGSSTNKTTGCPDCVVVVAPCFQFTNQTGDLITTMQLTDYVSAIGTKICSMASQITTLLSAVQDHETRITELENAPPPTFILPQVTPACVLPAVPTDMNIVLTATEQKLCELLSATGQANDLFAAIALQCAGLNGQDQLGGAGVMSSIPGWNSNVQNIAGSITNLWLTLCDIRAAIASIQSTCCPTGCDGITLNFTAGLDGSLMKLYITGTIPAEFIQCAPGTTTFTISDQSGHTINYPVDIIAALNQPGGYSIDLSVTPLNLADDLTITANPCLKSNTTGSTCQYAINYVAVYPGTCPAMTYVQTDQTITYNGNITSGSGSFIVELWDSSGTTLVASQTSNLSAPATLAGTFAGLVANTIYKVRVKVVPGGDGVPLYCPFTAIQTSPSACPDPTDVVATLNV